MLEAIAKILAALASWWEARQMLSAGKAMAKAETLDAVEKSQKIEKQLELDLGAKPERLRDNDGFRRD